MIIRSIFPQLFPLLITFQLASTNNLNCSLITTTNDHCNLSNDLIDKNSTIIISSVIGKGFELAAERISTKEFSSSYHSVKFFPANFAEYFPNLEIISITHAGMKEIKQSDFKKFPKLTILDLSYNEFQIIEANLFRFNSELKEIFMEENQIFSIHPNVFCGLSKIVKLKMGKVNFDWSYDENRSYSSEEGFFDSLKSNKEFFGVFIIFSVTLNVFLIFVIILIFCKSKRKITEKIELGDDKNVENSLRKFSNVTDQILNCNQDSENNSQMTRNQNFDQDDKINDFELDFTPQVYQEPIDDIRASNLYQEVDYQSCNKTKSSDQEYSQVYDENIYQECEEKLPKDLYAECKPQKSNIDSKKCQNFSDKKISQNPHKSPSNILIKTQFFTPVSTPHSNSPQFFKYPSSNLKFSTFNRLKKSQTDLNYSSPVDCLRSETSDYSSTDNENAESINIYDDVFEENLYENSITMDRKSFVMEK